MMTKRLWYLISAEDKERGSIKERTKVLKVYKNGNYKIPGQRSITPGNWKRKRKMMLHHAEVREYRRFYGKEREPYLKSVKEKGKEIKKGKGMFIESLQKYYG